MKVLGIDPGTAACGYGIVHTSEGRLKATVHGWWRTPAGQRQELRLKTRQVLVNGMKYWLSERGWDLRQANLNAFFKQWDLAQEDDEFVLMPPGRLRTSFHLAEYAWFQGPQLSWKHRTVTYLNAAGSLVVGYQNVHRLDEWRLAVKSAIGRGRGAEKSGEGAVPQ